MKGSWHLTLLKMAWRNLIRKKRRTFITSFSVAFGVLLAVTFTASGDYSYTNMVNTSVTLGLGHITVEPPGYNDTPTLAKNLETADSIREKVLTIPGIKAAKVRIMGQAIFATGAKNVGGSFIAIDPAKETEKYNIFLRSIIEGKLFDDPAGRGILIGKKMAQKLKLRLGKKIIYTMTDKNGEIVSEVSRVSGIFKTGDDTLDGTIAILPIDHIRSTLIYGPEGASFVSIFIDDHRQAAILKKEIKKTIGNDDHETLTWRETQAELAGLIAMDKAGNYFMQFLAGLLIAAGILNTLLMSVMERTREFGVMLAIGMSPWQVIKLIMIESILIGILGLIMGIVITTPWFIYMSEIGINLSKQIGDDYSAAGVIVDPVLKFRLFKESAYFILAVIFSLTLLAGIYPAFKAGRIPPVESLKTI